MQLDRNPDVDIHMGASEVTDRRGVKLRRETLQHLGLNLYTPLPLETTVFLRSRRFLLVNEPAFSFI